MGQLILCSNECPGAGIHNRCAADLRDKQLSRVIGRCGIRIMNTNLTNPDLPEVAQ